MIRYLNIWLRSLLRLTFIFVSLGGCLTLGLFCLFTCGFGYLWFWLLSNCFGLFLGLRLLLFDNCLLLWLFGRCTYWLTELLVCFGDWLLIGLFFLFGFFDCLVDLFLCVVFLCSTIFCFSLDRVWISWHCCFISWILHSLFVDLWNFRYHSRRKIDLLDVGFFIINKLDLLLSIHSHSEIKNIKWLWVLLKLYLIFTPGKISHDVSKPISVIEELSVYQSHLLPSLLHFE